MNNKSKTVTNDELDADVTAAIARAVAPADDVADSIASVRTHLLQEIGAQAAPAPDFVTIRGDDCDRWTEFAPRAYKKVLRIDLERQVETFLLRLEPGAQLDPHDHESDELCMVLEGEFTIDDLHLRAGDFHFAAKGSRHGHVHTRTGTLVVLQAALAA